MEPEDELALLVADIFELAGLFRRRGEEIAGAVGQSQARWQVMSVASEGDWTVSGAARRLGVSRQAVQRVADLLVADGLCTFEDNPAHRRAPLLRLTAAGRGALLDINRQGRAWRRAVTSAVGAGAVADVRRSLGRLLQEVGEAGDRRPVPAPRRSRGSSAEP